MKLMYLGYIYENVADEYLEDDSNEVTVEQVQSEFNNSFWNNPSTLYHATRKENVASISKNGMNADPLGTRSVGGGNKLWKDQNLIFTVSEDGIEDIKRYGSIIIEINSRLMKEDMFTPKVSLDDSIAEVYASGDDIDYNELRDIGQFAETVVIHTRNIPVKYLKIPKLKTEKIIINSETLGKILSGQFDYSTDKISKLLLSNVDKLVSFDILKAYRYFLPEYKNNELVLNGIKKYITNTVEMKKDLGRFDSDKEFKLYSGFYGLPEDFLNSILN